MSERLSLPGFSHRQPDDSTTALPATHEKPRPRHSKVRLILAGLGTFLVATALLLEFYVAPQLIAWPVSFNQTDTLTATNASYYNAGTLQTKQDARLTYTLTIRSDAASSSHTTAVWESSAVLMDPATKYTVNVVTQRAAFNRRTGQLSNCCGASLNGDTRVRQTGLGVAWPIGVQKTTYQVFDPNSGHTFPAAYAGTATVGGVAAYRFVQHVPPTVAQQMAGIPVSILGLPGNQVVVANRYWQATNTFWVNPQTGVPVNEQVQGQSVLRGPGGQGKLVVADVDLKMTPATVHQLTSLASKNATSITLLQVIAPVTTGVIGLILLALALVPFFRRRMPEPADDGPGLVSDSIQRQDASAANGAVARESRDASPAETAARDGQDASPAETTVSHEDQAPVPAESAVSPEAQSAGPANGTRPREDEETGPAGAAMTCESADRPDSAGPGRAGRPAPGPSRSRRPCRAAGR